MKKIFVLVIIPLLIIFASCVSKKNINKMQSYIYTDFIDSIMISKFLYFDSLMIVTKLDKNLHPYFLNTCNDNILYMEKLTGIKSNYHADFIGRKNITKDDYINWTAWYFKNRKFLKWNEVTKKIEFLP